METNKIKEFNNYMASFIDKLLPEMEEIYKDASGGGIIRDLCIGSIPPAGLNNWRYLVI